MMNQSLFFIKIFIIDTQIQIFVLLDISLNLKLYRIFGTFERLQLQSQSFKTVQLLLSWIR
jgi:hypothetical protein